MLATNPYIAGNPVGNTQAFIGREDVLRAVLAVLRQPEQNAITLYGQRRIGKTSVLQALVKRLPQEGPYRPVYFDLQDKAAWPLARVLVELARELAEKLDLPAPDLGADPEKAFRRAWLPEVLANLPVETCLVLLFDEFDVLADPKGGQAAAAFFPYLRDLLAIDLTRLQFVFVIGRNPGDLSSIAMSIFKGTTSQRVSLLSEKNTEKLARLSEAVNGLKWQDEAVQVVWKLTHGHPFLTQSLCSQVWEQAHDETDSPAPVTAAQVEAAVGGTLEASRNTLEWLWDGLGPAERIVASALAQSGPLAVDDEGLERILREGGVRLIIRELQNAPQLLQDWDLLEPTEGGYIFRVELLRQWLQLNRPLKRVQQEMDRVQPLAENLYNAASGYYENGDLKEAETTLKQALRANPNHIRANELLAELLISQNRLEEARSLLEVLFQNAPASARPRLVQVYLAQAGVAADNQTRLGLYEKVLEFDPAQPKARQELKMIKQAEQQVKELAYRFSESKTLVSQHDWDKAKTVLKWIIFTQPEYSEQGLRAADLLAYTVNASQPFYLRLSAWFSFKTFNFINSLAYYKLRLALLLVALLMAFCLTGLGWIAIQLQLWDLVLPLRTVPITPTPETQVRDTDGMVMVLIPSGTFKMGSSLGASDEQPVHDVSLTAFWMDENEVTNAMYQKCVQYGFCQPPPTENYHYTDQIYANYPVVYINWNQAQTYCTWAGGQMQDVRLPSEAEWEYAARGGLEQNPYPWGAEIPSCQEGVKSGTNYGSCSKKSAIAVKTFAPNGYGLYDLAGNVWEWVADWYSNDYYKNSSAQNPTGPESGSSRVLRGGSWVNSENILRVSDRGNNYPAYTNDNIGFRCARSR
jgi:formylglycine-generating enzyme required for sulfatase activity/tetratricopeptide (TPR) repeat protein